MDFNNQEKFSCKTTKIILNNNSEFSLVVEYIQKNEIFKLEEEHVCTYIFYIRKKMKKIKLCLEGRDFYQKIMQQ